MKRVWLWRHGQTDYNVEQRVQGQVDIPLNAVGEAQAARAAELLNGRLGDEVEVRIVSSDLVRAVSTASALSRIRDVEIAVDTDLRERSFGPWEGHTRAEMERKWPQEFAVWRAGGEPEGIRVETKDSVATRVVSSIMHHADQLNDREVLVVVSHGSAITQSLVRMLGLRTQGPSPIRGLDNCHWSEIALRGEPGECVLMAHNLGWCVA